MKKIRLMKTLAIVLTLALAFGIAAGCAPQDGGTAAPGATAPAGQAQGGDAATPAGDSGRTSIRVGYVGPLTGPQARFTMGFENAMDRALEFMNAGGGYYMAGYGYLPVEFILMDSGSDAAGAAEAADRLATVENVDVLIGQWTPSHTIPVSIAAERHQIPALVVNGPDGGWLGAGPFEWAFACLFNMELLTREFYNGWLSLDTNRRVGLVFDNSSDGVLQSSLLIELAPEFGFEIVDPGRFPEGTTDFTAILTQLMAEDVDILATVNGTPQLITMWEQMQQLNFRPVSVLFNRGMHFSADVLQLGGEFDGEGVAWSAQWAADMPFVSSLSGQTVQELNQAHSEGTGQAPDLVVGWDWLIFDILDDVFSRIDSLEPETIRDALAATDLPSIYGHVRFDENNLFTTPSFMGQWLADDTWGFAAAVASAEYDPTLESVGLIPMPWTQ